MKSLQKQIVLKPLLISLVVLLAFSFVLTYLIEKKSIQQNLNTLEYIRDSKFKSLNKDNLSTAFDFTSLSYSTYIIDQNGKPLFDIKYEVSQELKDLCKTNDAQSKIIKQNNLERLFSVRKNGDYCFVVEGNTNANILLGQFTQKILYFFVFGFLALLYLVLFFIYKKIYKPIKTVKENSENVLISNWDKLTKSNTKVEELVDLEKYSGYLIELLKQGKTSLDSQKALEIKEIQAKYISKKAIFDINKFKLAVDSAPNFISIVDMHGYIIYINKEISKVIDITFQSAENKRITDLWHKDDKLEDWKSKYDEAMKNKQSVKFSSFGIKKNNVKFEGEIAITPIENENGSVENFLVIERDVTEERQKERIKSEFISVVSHELRTPMTVIRGYSSILADGTLGELNEKQKDYINKINSETGRLLELANDMLDIQKFESGKIELKFEKKNIFEIVQKVFNSYTDPFKKKNLLLNIENNLKDEAHSLASLDPKYFERIIGNLLSNALKYTEKGEVKIFLLNPDEDHIVLAVKDTGVGIKEAAIPHLFERFYQADGVMARKQEGSGLGLSIVKTVTEAHGGMAWVESKLGVGSTFYVAIPVLK